MFMTLGIEVTKAALDSKCAQAVLAVRAALEKVEAVQAWLANHPVVTIGGVDMDPLTEEPYNYTADEAYAMRLYFGTVDGLRISNTAMADVGRKMTGLE
jgi:hypothetical protein